MSVASSISRPASSLCPGSCGFADQSHFTRAFTKRVGAAPGAWRRQRHGEMLAEIA